MSQRWTRFLELRIEDDMMCRQLRITMDRTHEAVVERRKLFITDVALEEMDHYKALVLAATASQAVANEVRRELGAANAALRRLTATAWSGWLAGWAAVGMLVYLERGRR